MSSTLPLFWNLSSASKKDRIDASVKLVGALERFQTQFVPKDSPETSDDEEDGGGPAADGLDVLNAQDVSYSIRRLIRGLASPRESSRLGFAVALTELLSRINTVTCSQIISIILDSSKTQGSMTGQEERDVLFARLFGLTSVIQSGLLVRQSPLPTSASGSAPASSLAGYNELFTQLLALGEKKSWLRESAWWTASLALDALNGSEVVWKEEAIEITLQRIFIDNKVWTPEKIALGLKLQTLYPESDWRKFLSPTFKNSELLSAGNLSTLAKILKESGLDDEDGADGSKSVLGNWKPQIHFAWDIILDQLLADTSSTGSSKASFKEFFRVVVDESLFSSTSSPERKYWGFQIFQKVLPRVDAGDMPMLFTKNFMRSWINHLSNNDRYLHKAAKQVATDIQSFVQKNPTLGFTLILQLTGTNGNRQFDRLTKTKTVESILASMNAEGIETYIDYLLKQVDEESSEKNDIQAVNAKRAWIIDQLGALIRNGSIPKNDDWIQSILDWFIVNGFFVIKRKSERSPYRALHALPAPMFSDDLRQSCRARFLTCLADLTGQVMLVRSGNDKTQKVTGVASNGEFWISRALRTIETLEKDTKHVSLLEGADEDHLAVRDEARQMIKTLKGMPADRQDAAKGSELLLSAIMLQQYNTSEEDMHSAALQACIDATSRMFTPKIQNCKTSRESSNNTESASEPIDILVDSIIGFMEQSTAYLRSVGNLAFSLLSGTVQETTIDLILTQLERRDPAELAASEEDEEMEDNEDEDEEGENEDNESSSIEDEDEDEGDGDGDEDVRELRRKIEEALKVNGIEAATGDSEEESDEDLMDDDQMMAIDEQLTEVFRSRANEKKSSKEIDAQREATHFKNRVLDLVDIFIKKQSSSQYIIRLVLPLVELIAGTGSDERQLADKATSLLRNRIGKSKDLPSCADSEQLATILDELHGRARRVRSSEMLATINQCSLYLSKVMLHSGAEDSVLHVYRQSLVDFITRKASPLNTSFLQDFLRHHPASGWSLRDDIIDASAKAANAYRQCQAFQLLQVILNQLPALGDRQQEILAFMPKFRTALADFMTKAFEEKIVLTVAQMKDLYKLGLVAVRQTQRATSPNTLQTIWPTSTWDALQKKLVASERFKASMALQTMYKQMVKISQGTVLSPKKSGVSPRHIDNDVPVTTAAKRKADIGEDDEDTVVVIKAKRKRVKKTNV